MHQGVERGLRRLVSGRAVSALGDGLWITIWLLYFTRVVGLSAVTVGVGMAVAGGFGFVLATPLGALADRYDPRSVLVIITAVRGAAMGGYLLVAGAPAFVMVSVVFVATANGGNAVRTALVAGLLPDNEDRVRALARLRVAGHVGYAAGAGAGALVLAADSAAIYLLAILANMLSFLILAAITATVPRPDPTPRARRKPAALRDGPYLAVAATTAVFALCWSMLSVGVPLWISQHTRLPLVLSGIVAVISSVGIAVGQIPATRLARGTTAAARTALLSGLTLAASCLLLASTNAGTGWLAVSVLLVAALLHLTGELGYIAARWTLSVGLMHEDGKGAYQGVTEATTAGVQMVGPAVFSLSLNTFGWAGWLLLAGIFVAAALPIPALTRWAAGSRATVG